MQSFCCTLLGVELGRPNDLLSFPHNLLKRLMTNPISENAPSEDVLVSTLVESSENKRGMAGLFFAFTESGDTTEIQL